MAGTEVFGSPWFWAAAALWLAVSAGRVCGTPRRLVSAARRGALQGEMGPAELALLLTRWRLGPGRGPIGLEPLMVPLLGALAASLGFSALMGDAFSAAALTLFAPGVAAERLLRTKVGDAAQAVVTGASEEERTPALAAFSDALDQAAKLKLAASLAALALTVCAAAAFAVFDGGV